MGDREGANSLESDERPGPPLEVLADLNLNARQQEAVAYVKRRGRIANSEYQQLTGATRKTAARDLDELITKGVFRRAGEKRGSHYLLTGQK